MTAKVISAGYIPPELLPRRGDDNSRAQYDDEVDIWSCGVIAFEVATLEQFMPTADTTRSQLQLHYIAQRMGTAGGVATGSYVPEQLRGVCFSRRRGSFSSKKMGSCTCRFPT